MALLTINGFRFTYKQLDSFIEKLFNRDGVDPLSFARTSGSWDSLFLLFNGIKSLIGFPILLILRIFLYYRIMGIIIDITFGVPIIIFWLIWTLLVHLPLILLSWLWHKMPFIRILLFPLGTIIAITGDLYLSFVPDMGEKMQKINKGMTCHNWFLAYYMVSNPEPRNKTQDIWE